MAGHSVTRMGRQWLWLIGAPMAMAAGLFAQSGAAAQEVVQSLPPAGSAELSAALQRLARNDRDLDALLDAGDAALKLGDVPAAIGFFGRAQAISPNHARVALGLGRAYTLSRRPVEALRYFAEAERAGTPEAAMAAERGLAFDLVGDAASAQQLYRLALSRGANNGVQRNLALSQAISGDRAGFEATLLPLLQQGDNAAFRTRAFGLAILGDTEAAVQIARDMMGPNAQRVEPYLRYMARLTPAQQAAAGALGVFPRTAEIGRDDAQIADYQPQGRQAGARADAALTPSGTPLGKARSQQAAKPAQPSRRVQRADAREERRGARRPERRAQNTQELPPVAGSTSVTQPPPVRVVVTQRDTTQQEAPVAAPSITTADRTPAERPAATQPVDLGRQPGRQASPPPPPPPAPTPDLNDAFADFARPTRSAATPRAGSVDITAIDVPRERDAPPAPLVPSRHWVQLATGRDVGALAYDWRRITRTAQGNLAGKEGYTVPWGEANRLLAGPYDSAREAQEVVGKLRAAGLDSFAYTSARGEEIVALTYARPAPAAETPVADPARHWVQVATGRDRSALAFDWRRIAREAQGALDDRGPFVAGWGQTNRLLAGPYDSPASAREAVNRLKALQIDAFTFSSAAGEPVEPLD